MPSKLNRLAKEELRETLANVGNAIFVDFTGVGSEETYLLRKALREAEMMMRVVKTSLAKIALKEIGTEVQDEFFKGSLGVVHSDDPAAVAKLLLAHRRKFRRSTLKVKGGVLDRKPIGPQEVTELSNLPERDQLLGMVAGSIAAPLTAFIGVQAAIIRKLLFAIDAIKEKREGGENPE
ncbi:50S ribosomal protein L10 [Planctomycetota bacterium]